MSEERKSAKQKPADRGDLAVQAEKRHEPSVGRSPDYKAHYGRVQAAVWSRDFDGRTVYSVSLTRNYKEKSTGQRQRTTHLDKEDLLPAAKALDDAYTWIQRQRQHAREDA